jgi:hypothetical protein
MCIRPARTGSGLDCLVRLKYNPPARLRFRRCPCPSATSRRRPARLCQACPSHARLIARRTTMVPSVMRPLLLKSSDLMARRKRIGCRVRSRRYDELIRAVVKMTDNRLQAGTSNENHGPRDLAVFSLSPQSSACRENAAETCFHGGLNQVIADTKAAITHALTAQI